MPLKNEKMSIGICLLGKIEAIVTPNLSLTRYDNTSFYDDSGSLALTRRARWSLWVDGVQVYDSGFLALTASVPIGTGSTANQILVPNGTDDFVDYLTSLSVATTASSQIILALIVKNEAGDISNTTRIIIQEGVNLAIASLQPMEDYRPGMTFLDDTDAATTGGVPKYKWYRLSTPNNVSSALNHQLKQLFFP